MNVNESSFNFDDKYDFFKGSLYTSDKFKLFLNYWIGDLLIDYLQNDLTEPEDSKNLILKHFNKLYENCFSENIIGNKDLVDSLNHNFLEKIHPKLHLSAKYFVKEGNSVLQSNGGNKHVLKDDIKEYICENILKSSLIRDFVYNTLANVGGSYSKSNPTMSKNVKKTGLLSSTVDTQIIIFQFINLLKFNHVGYLNLIYDVNQDTKELKDRTKSIEEDKLREIESKFIFKNVTNKLIMLAKNYIAKDKNPEEPEKFLRYDTRKKLKQLISKKQNEVQQNEVQQNEKETDVNLIGMEEINQSQQNNPEFQINQKVQELIPEKINQNQEQNQE